MKTPIITLSATKASMVLSDAAVISVPPWQICPLCNVLGIEGCDDDTGTRRRIFRDVYDGASGRINVDRLASCISAKR